MKENQFGVILEEVRDMFKLLAEGQKTTDERLDRVEKELKQEINGLKKDVLRIEGRVAHLEGNMTRIEGKLDAYMQHTANVTEITNDHEERITELEKVVNG